MNLVRIFQLIGRYCKNNHSCKGCPLFLHYLDNLHCCAFRDPEYFEENAEEAAKAIYKILVSDIRHHMR